MRPEPVVERTVAFVDGQNLFHAARECFGYSYPNYDAHALAAVVCRAAGWTLTETRFYTGVPDARDNSFWNHFWSGKLLTMSRQGCVTFTRSLRYRSQRVRLPDGQEHTFLAAEEKGIDVRIALDIVRMAHRRQYDVAVILSQGPGPRRGGYGGARDRARAEALDQGRVRVSSESHGTQPARHRQD